MVKYEARGKCPTCHKDILRLWEAPSSGVPADPTELDRIPGSCDVDCPFCNSSVTMIISEASDLPRHNLRSGWLRL